MNKWLIAVSIFCMISLSAMKRGRNLLHLNSVSDDKILDYIVEMAQKSMAEVEKERVKNIQNFFYPDKSISQEEQQNTQQHVVQVKSMQDPAMIIWAMVCRKE